MSIQSPSTLLSSLSTTSDPASSLNAHEALSGITGTIALVCWICVLFPQLIVNYRNNSSKGVSIPWLMVWLVGNILNLVGAWMAGVVGIIIANGAYFCLANSALIIQCFYYRIKEGRTGDSGRKVVVERLDESRIPFLSDDGVGNGHNDRENEPDEETEETLIIAIKPDPTSEITTSSCSPYAVNVFSVLGVIATGLVLWTLAYSFGAWKPSPPPPSIPGPKTDGAIIARDLGWLSAVICLAARALQITKNWRAKSCEGLSILLFIIAILGNTTYSAALLLHSTQSAYLAQNMPWIFTSLGALFMDSVIFTQFIVYGEKKKEDHTA